MSNSLEFCIKTATDQTRSNLMDVDFSEAFEMPIETVAEFFKNNKIYTRKIGNTTLEITYDPDADFQYYTNSVSTHDGTLMFVLENMERCLAKVLNGKTYYIPAGVPKNFNGAVIQYTIGNFVVCNEYGEQFAPKDKPWMTEMTTVLLPIKYSYKEGPNETSI